MLGFAPLSGRSICGLPTGLVPPPTPTVDHLPGGGIPRRKRKRNKLLEIPESLDLHSYLEDLYKRLYEPETALPESVLAKVRKAISATPDDNLFLPKPEDIAFKDLKARMKDIETLLWALEVQEAMFARIEEEEAEFLLMQ